VTDSRNEGVSRRDFVRTIAAAGAGMMVSSVAWPQTKKPNTDELRIVMIGTGSEGLNLLRDCLKIPSIRFTAICDIWPYYQRYAANTLKRYKQPVNVYVEYQEMLAKEKFLDAVIIATPDWVHAEQTVACLKAGKHVYCEKEMSNTLEGAKQMVLAARETGKVLQIGHQRRSNLRYQHALKLIRKDKVLGRITDVNGQWNRPELLHRGWAKKYELDSATLKKYGYDTMERFRNWRWFQKFSGGPIADLGSHQIDVYNWFLDAMPRDVMASGGTDYYKESEWYDNVMVIYTYNTKYGVVRAFYQILNTTSYGGFFEAFMGDEGTLVISEDTRKGFLFREVRAKHRSWEDQASRVEKGGQEAITLKIGETLTPEGQKTPEAQKLLAESKKPVHQLHLENFFSAIRNGTPLNCPPEVGYESAVSVLKVNEAITARRTLTFKPSEFKV